MEKVNYYWFLDTYLIKDDGNGEKVYDEASGEFKGWDDYSKIIIASRDARYDYGDYSPSDIDFITEEQANEIIKKWKNK